MTTDNGGQRSVLVIGRSQLVLDDAIAGLRDLGYRARGTNEFFSDIPGRFDPSELDMVVFGGAVPPDRNAELREEISAINPKVIFVQGLAGIPGLIINQIQGAFTLEQQDPAQAATYRPDDRTIQLILPREAEVKVTLWWGGPIVSPDPKSDSLIVLEDHLPTGAHTIPVPDYIPPERAFATVQIGAAIYAFSIAAEG